VEPLRPTQASRTAPAPAAEKVKTADQAKPPVPPPPPSKAQEPEKIAATPARPAEDRIAREIGSPSDLEKNVPAPAAEERRDNELKERDEAASPPAAALAAPSAAQEKLFGKQEPKDAKKRGSQPQNLMIEGPAAKPSAPVAPGSSGPRAFLYETESYSATFTEDGLVTLVARRYACSVTVPVPETTAPPPSSAGGETTDLKTLFRLATSAEFLASSPSRSAGTAEGSAAGGGGEPATLTLHDAEGDTIHSVTFRPSAGESAPPVLRKLDRMVQTLLRQTYRGSLESRCGPIPPGALPSP